MRGGDGRIGRIWKSVRPDFACAIQLLWPALIAVLFASPSRTFASAQHGQSHAAPNHAAPPQAQHSASRAQSNDHQPPREHSFVPNSAGSRSDYSSAHSGPPGPRRPLITAQPPSPRTGFRAPYVPPPGAQHLGSWLASHSGESVQDQVRSLRQEPGFSGLPPVQQQHLIQGLHQLDAMSPARRQRTLDRIENMERLSPQRKQAVRNAAQQLQQMPPQRKQQMQTAFRALRDLPPSERPQALNSPQYRGRFNDRERDILRNLLSVEPYQPGHVGVPPRP
jgi:hypothetical protein